VLTGVGAALRSAGLEAGQTVAVFGCGGVGLSIVQGARIGGASQIIGVDVFDESSRWPSGWAPRTSSTARRTIPSSVCVLLTPRWCGSRLEAVGNTTLVVSDREPRHPGTATIVGVMPPDAKIEFPWMAIRPECKVQTSRMGGNRFARTFRATWSSIARAADADEMVSRRGPASATSTSVRAMKAGEVARSVLMFD